VGWAVQVKALSSRFQVVTFDNRGVGQTDLPPDPVYGTAQMADDAAALLHEFKIGRAHVVGKDDILTPPSFSKALARRIPRARLAVLPGGHGFFLEHAGRFNCAVLRFLSFVRAK
jgi:pimeloyl-ACP methyl ester carboxylesterase